MKILLISTPEQIRFFNWVEVYVPCLGLASLAGNLDGDSDEVKIIDLVYHQKNIFPMLRSFLQDYRPDLVGISAMSFQYDSTKRLAAFFRRTIPEVKIAIGGYHPSLEHQEIADSADAPLFDFIVRGEGEATFRELVHCCKENSPLQEVAGLSFRVDGRYHHNPPRPLIDLEEIAPPRREARVFGYRPGWNGWMDSTETSRGCTLNCSFCSITAMYGRRLRTYALDRIIEDLRRIRDRGGKRVFFIDDNITLKPKRFETICEAIVDHGLNDLSYAVQCSSVGIASSEDLLRKMREAGFHFAQLGIESTTENRLKTLKKGAILDQSRRALEYLHKYKIAVAGSFIIGLPDDTREDARRIFRFARDQQIDFPFFAIVTPFPGTEIRKSYLEMGLVDNPHDYRTYNGLTANVHTRHLTRRQLHRLQNRGYLLHALYAILLGNNKYMTDAITRFSWFQKLKIHAGATIYYYYCITGGFRRMNHHTFEPLHRRIRDRTLAIFQRVRSPHNEPQR